MRRPTRRPRAESPVIAAMQNLRASGDKSFEQLIAELLSAVSGEHIRRCVAGAQGGIDAVAAAIPFAVELKRYVRSPDGRELRGALSAAVDNYPDLELWVLATTAAISAQALRDLTVAAEREGVAVLILDANAAEPELPMVESLAALAATDIKKTVDVLSDPQWRVRGKAPDVAAIRKELAATRKRSGFASWQGRLRRDLHELPTWRHLVRSQNHRLHAFIVRDSANAFDTPYDQERAVPRTAEANLTAWWQSSRAAESIVVVTGDRYDGKTWLVFRWLAENVRDLSIPVFLYSSRKLQTEHGDIEGLIRRDAEQALGAYRRHAATVLARHRSRTKNPPWCIVVLDGADEYVKVPEALGDAILWAHPPETQPHRPADGHTPMESHAVDRPNRAAVLITCRAGDFARNSSWLGKRQADCVALGPYDDQELAEALRRSSLSAEEYARIPESARKLMRHPRFFQLAIRYWQELGRFAEITAGVLHFLDAADKVVPHTSTTGRWEPQPLMEFLARLANGWRSDRELSQATLRQHVAAVTDEIDLHVRELISGGIVERRADGKLIPDAEKLSVGMGLYIGHKLRSVDDPSQFSQVLNEVLEPHRDDDEKVRWLRAAVTTSALIHDEVKNPAVLDCLIEAWLSARNFSRQDLDDLRNLTPHLFSSVMRMLSSPRAVSRGALPLAEAMIHAETGKRGDEVGDAIRRMLRLVPTDPPWYVEKGLPGPEVAQAVKEPSLDDFDLQLADRDAGKSVRDRHRLALFLATEHPALARPIDLLAFISARRVSDWEIDGAEKFAIRLILSRCDRAWFEEEVQSWSSQPESRRAQVLREMIGYADRTDLHDLLTKLPEGSEREWRPALTRAELSNLQENDDPKTMLRQAARARSLAVEPAGSSPSRAWRSAFAKVVAKRFEGSLKLYSSRSITLDGLDLRDIEPALAAWAPVGGVAIWRRILADIPKRVEEDDASWSWDVEGHASLLTASDRLTFLETIRNSPKSAEHEHGLRRLYLCVIVGSSAKERLRLLLEHPFHLEWTEFYAVLAMSRDESLKQKAITAVRTESEPLRLKRARFLLSQLGGTELSKTELAHLLGDLSHKDSQDGAHQLLENSRISDSTSADALGPLVHVAKSLSEAAWQYEAFLHVNRHPGRHGVEWLARARSAPATARYHGANAASDDGAVAEGIKRLATQVEENLRSSGLGRADQFPEGIASEIGDAAFNAWVALLVGSPMHARHFHSGLLVPVLSHALRTRHPAAKELWKLAYPFQRGRFSSGIGFTRHGIDWTLCEIHDPAVDDTLAREILRELLTDCRSNSEMMQIAIGARVESVSRLTSVIKEALHSETFIDRARARYITGWMPENNVLRKLVAAPDPSRWVERVGKNAIERLDRERWAREHLHRFLFESNRVRRWAAARLFLACSDAATPIWATDMIWTARDSSPIRRAEAYLLVGKIRSKPTDSDFRDYFFGLRDGELQTNVPPWRQPIQWDDVELPDDEED